MAKRKVIGSIWLDSLFATIFVYLFMFIVSNIAAFRIFDGFDTIGQALEDMEITDLSFSQIRDQPGIEEDIILVNIGNLQRAGIARQIEVLDQYNPAVIGIDSFFKGYNEDTLGTLSLANAITSAKNDVVMVAKVDQSDSLFNLHEGDEIYDVLYRTDEFIRGDSDYGIANLDTEAAFQQDVKICRTFPSYREVIGLEGKHIAFGAKLASYIDPKAPDDLLKRDNEYEVINYRGDFYNFYDNDTTEFRRFLALDYDEVLMDNFDPSLVKDKIIIMGYLGDDFTDIYSWEDKFFTPLNKKVAGRATPDMYGPVIHANIASMVLNRDYVHSLPDWLDMLLGVVLCYLNVLLFSYIYRTMGSWYDGLSKMIQIVEVILIVFIIILLFAYNSFKLELTIGLIAIALAGDLLEIYYGVIRNAAVKIHSRFEKKEKVMLTDDEMQEEENLAEA